MKQKSPKNKVALITGITGQDGSYLTELLLKKGYLTHGIIRRSSTFNTSRIKHLYKGPHDRDSRLFIHYGDLADEDTGKKIKFYQASSDMALSGNDKSTHNKKEKPLISSAAEALGHLGLIPKVHARITPV